MAASLFVGGEAAATEPVALSLQIDPACADAAARDAFRRALSVRLPDAVLTNDSEDAEVVVRWTANAGECVVLVESDDGVGRVTLAADAPDEDRSEAVSRVAWLAAIGMGLDPFAIPDPAEPLAPSDPATGDDGAAAQTTETDTNEREEESVPDDPDEPKPPPPGDDSAVSDGSAPSDASEAEPGAPDDDATDHEQPPEPFAPEVRRVLLGASVIPTVALPRRSRETVRRVSFNLLLGETVGVEGVEFTLGIARQTGFARGLQMAGIANLVSGEVIGAQLAVGANFAGTGGAEEIAGRLSGVQWAAGYNQALGGGAGVQWAAVNLARGTFTGLQLGGANIAHDVRGVQAGFANAATGEVTGLQFGLLNYAAASTISVGFFSYIRDEPIQATVTLDSSPIVTAGVRHGSEIVQNILGFSAGATEATTLSGLTYGIGTRVGDRIFANFDLVYSALWAQAAVVSEAADASGGTFAGHRLQPRASVGWQIAPRFAIVAGFSPTFFFTTRGSAFGLAPASASPIRTTGVANTYLYPDAHIGLRF